MIEFYPQIKSMHVAMIMASGTLFALRGGAALAGISVGAVMANKASHDRVALEWRPHAIVTQEMTGYRETVTPGQHNGQSGYFHRFQPTITREVVGTYQTPHIVHVEEPSR